MTSDSSKDVSNSILKDSQNTALEATKAGSVSKQASSAGDVTTTPVQSNPEQKKLAKEINGPKGLEPTRYGDWEAKGRCYDF